MSVQPISSVYRLQRAHGGGTVRCDEMTILPEHFALGLLRPVRSDDIGMGPTERQAPSCRGMSAGYLDDQPVVGSQVEFISAEQPGLGNTVESGFQKRLVHLDRVCTALVRLILLFPQQPTQRDGAFEQARGRHVRFGDRDRSRDRDLF